MNKHDNFEDNLYLLQVRIRLIQDTLILDSDLEIFFEKALDDIDFVDQALGNFLDKLKDNQQRIDRESLMDHLSELERQFSRILSDIIDGQGSISIQEIPSLKEKILDLQKISSERREKVEKLSDTMENYQEEPVVSSDEFNELLKEF